MSRERALLRWLGSKARIAPIVAPRIRAHLDHTGGKLVSLFYGSGAIEQLVGGQQIAAEKCPELRGLWEDLGGVAPECLFETLQDFDAMIPRTRRGHARARRLPRFSSPCWESARFLWLSALSFNGVWRVNARGQFNVPPDPDRLKRQWPFPSLEDFRRAQKRILGVQFTDCYRKALLAVQPGDVVLSDPPYLGGFTTYTAGGFPRAEHRRLAEALRMAAGRGTIAVVAFNSPAASPLYSWPGVQVERLSRSGRISSDGAGRGDVEELLITAGLRAEARDAA